jgi:hypothetical protein
VSERFGLHLQVNFSINVGCVEGDMSQPGADRVIGLIYVASIGKKPSRIEGESIQDNITAEKT